MRTSQSFPFYPTDFLMGTALMTCEEVGAYIRLLCHQWDRGSLPADCKVIARLAQTSEDTAQSILHKFSGHSRGKIYNRKMEEVRKSLIAYKKSRSENGAKGGRPKKHMVSECLNGEKHTESLPSPSPSPVLLRKEPKARGRAGSAPLPMPEGASSERIGILSEWIAYKSEKRQGYKPAGWRSLMTQICSVPDSALIGAIRFAMANNYTGFSPDWERGGKPTIAKPEPLQLAPNEPAWGKRAK